MNRLDIWINNSNSSDLIEYRPLKAELLLRQRSFSEAHLDWNVRKVYMCGL